ncbi:unnamed protein product [Rotaria socialis]|uniref:Uncharacterized protein n=1 Tax=Rotaria socialis TaxID=392032 RepID=A0A821IVK4_9BILA|nr:unnamed protein product [Rotaria socialis]
MKDMCTICNTTAGILKCQGCNLVFCRNDFDLHRAKLDQDLDICADELNTFQSGSGEQYNSLELMLSDKINTWELKSIQKIQQEARQQGWAGHNDVYMNGKCSKNVNGYTSGYSRDDVIELILDCDHHPIRMTNIRSTKSYEINVDLKDCRFPWMLHLNLFHHETRIRINPLNVSRKQ